MKMRKDLLFVQSTTEIGGAERVLLNLFAESEELRRRSLIVSLGFGNGDLPAQLRAAGAEVIELARARLREPWRLVSVIRTLVGIVRTHGVRAVIGNGTHPQILAGWVARLARVRSVFIVHAIYSFPARGNGSRERLALVAPCDLMLAVSSAAQAAAARLRPGIESRVVYNGTPANPDVPAVEVRAARTELRAGEGEILIGAFGRLQRSKGQDVFVKAASDVVKARPQARFVIVGGSFADLETEYAGEIAEQISALGLSDRIVSTGFRSDVDRLMAACDIVCNPARGTESFGMTIVEAMALARPVIATAVGGPSEIIISEDHGIIIPPDDVGAMVRAMIALIDDPERRSRMGARARARVRSNFSIDIMATTLLGSLDALLARTRGC
jgi:glycosyltransferase involved in cell wall biosynthesis